MMRILLGQLANNGDCLYATILARQLRQDYPDAHITWAISPGCAKTLAGNPHIDELWEVPFAGTVSAELQWSLFEREALRRYTRREFDHVLLSQVWPGNMRNFDGTVRPSILRAYGKPITVPVANVIQLTDAEIDRVERFAESAGLGDVTHRILFECSARSGQSFVKPDLAQDIAGEVYRQSTDTTIVFNSHLPIELRDRRSRQSNSLSLREFAHLTRHASLFVGVGSGGSVAASSTASNPLPWIQLLESTTSVYASFAHDFEYFGISDYPVVEMTARDVKTIADCIVSACQDGIGPAKVRFDQPIPVNFDYYFKLIGQRLIKLHHYFDAAASLEVTAERYGWAGDLVDYAKAQVLPNLCHDPIWIYPNNRRKAESFRHAVETAAALPRLDPRQRPGAGNPRPGVEPADCVSCPQQANATA